jgi:hypothetical protein
MNRGTFLAGCLASSFLCGWLVLASRTASGQAEGRPVSESAKALAREWRHPDGDYVSSGPDDSDTLRLEWGTVDAAFEDVGTYYAKRCGRQKVDGPVFQPLAQGGKDTTGYTMAAAGHIVSQLDFAQNTARSTVHVTVQRQEGKKVLVRTVVGVR